MKHALALSKPLIAGICVASLLASVLGGASHPPTEILLPILFGNSFLLLVLLPLLGIRAVFRRSKKPFVAGEAAWFGFFLGLLPSALGPFFSLPWLLAIAGMFFVLVCWWAPSLPPWSSRFSSFFLLAIPLLSIAGGLWVRHTLQQENLRRSRPSLPAPPPGEDFQAPDIILVSIDTLRADAIVGPRNPDYQLPFFDHLREEAQWWDYAYAPSNQTLPGHATMLSGRNALTNRVRYNLDPLPGADWMRLLPEYFQDAGFQTAGVISNGIISGDVGFARGFEVYDDSTARHFGVQHDCVAYLLTRSWFGLLLPDRYQHGFLSATTFRILKRPAELLRGRSNRERGAVTNEQALSMLQQLYQHDRPFFFFLHYIDPHHPYGAPPQFDGQLSAGFEDLPPRFLGTPEFENMIEMEQLQPAMDDLRSVDPQRQAEAQRAAQYFHRLYLENVLYLDSLLAEVKARVDKSGRPTIWIITADHGEQFGEHNVLMHSEDLFKDSVRVPFFFFGPGIQAGHQQGIPELADVAPTLLEAAGLEVPSDMNGRSLLGGYGQVPAFYLAGDDRMVMLRYQNYKLIAKRGKDGVDSFAFFDLAADPEEQINLHGQHPEEARLEAILEEQLQQDTYTHSKQVLSGSKLAALQDLGYVNDVEE